MSEAIINDLRGLDGCGHDAPLRLREAAVRAVCNDGEVYLTPSMVVAVADEIEALRKVLMKVTLAYAGERDVMYECGTNAAGEYDPADEATPRAIAEMDALIQEAMALASPSTEPAESESP